MECRLHRPTAQLGGPWVSYKLGIQATAGELIQAVDVSITGQFHQRWSSSQLRWHVRHTNSQ